MIGRLKPDSREVTIVGAGIAGMLAAYELDRAGYTVTLLEARPRAGGLIKTEKTPYGIAERAAHSLLLTPDVQALCDDLGVELVEIRRDSKARFIYRDGKPRRFPLRLREAASAFFRACFALADSKTDPSRLTLEEWGMRHLGEAAVRYLLTPFVRGIYGATPSELSIGAAFPSLVVPHGHSLLTAILRRARTPTRKRMVAPRHGMEDLIRRLERRLEERLGDRFRKSVPVERLPVADNLLLAVPAHRAAELLRDEASELAVALSRVHYAPLMPVTAFAARCRAPRGVGLLFPEDHEMRSAESLGILFNSSAFEGRATESARAESFSLIFGGAHNPAVFQRSDAEIRKQAAEELRRFLGAGELVHAVICRQPAAVPCYGAELREVWAIAERTWCSIPGKILFGNYTGQVSIRGMVESARQMAAALHR